ncbi:MAG: hypothetical protein CMO30_03640 [Tistrella sp.]|uniref:DUF2946 domain-containing protein n=1 Tax=Tistrella mobilis TaxID=171437 RepID=A0A3B9II00_9PROT|nr:DUF2946 family protein [Tistrella sp.]MAD39812.1 hypothetical protein [Tistrella sp.]MBA74366.1 hypothetical protein [Tistrella sp.]HAE47492.1 hypothetical protein [Tistrella mobilis]
MATARDQGRGGSRGRAATRGLSAVRGHRLPAALVMLAVLVAQILGGAALNVSAAKAAETGQLVICTPTGLVQITVDDDGRPLDGDGHLRINHGLPCGGLCLAPALVATAPALPEPAAEVLARLQPVARGLPLPRDRLAPRPPARAPPLV